jgi:hypothetical protein
VAELTGDEGVQEREDEKAKMKRIPLHYLGEGDICNYCKKVVSRQSIRRESRPCRNAEASGKPRLHVYCDTSKTNRCETEESFTAAGVAHTPGMAALTRIAAVSAHNPAGCMRTRDDPSGRFAAFV